MSVEAFLAVLQLLIPLPVGYLACRAIVGRPANWAEQGIITALGTITGLGAWSLVSLSLLRVAGKLPTPSPLFEGTIATVTIAISYLSIRSDNQPAPVSGRQIAPASLHMRLAALFVIFLTAIPFFRNFLTMPDGGWDAWQTWNLLARFISRGGEHWTDMLTVKQLANHPDYPLLLPLSVARGWRIVGSETPLVPQLYGMLFTASMFALVICTLASMFNEQRALLAGLFLAGTPQLMVVGSMQYADIPIGCFLLASVILCVRQLTDPQPKLSLLAGFLAGCAAWTKNEGLLFVAALAIGQILLVWRHGRLQLVRLLLFLVGLTPVLALVLAYKFSYAPVNDIASGQGFFVTLSRLQDPLRYLTVLYITLKNCLLCAPLLPLLVFLRYFLADKDTRTAGDGILFIVITLAVIASGYLVVYLTTPWDLTWHLEASVGRLFLQLWPLLVFTVILSLGGRESSVSTDP